MLVNIAMLTVLVLLIFRGGIKLSSILYFAVL
jgi:hypothetical protein